MNTPTPTPAAVRAKPLKPELAIVPPTALAPPAPKPAAPVGEVGEVERFAVAKVEGVPGQSLALDAIYGAYCNWCSAEGCTALATADFETKFVKLAEIVGISHKKRGRKVVCEDVALAS